MQSYIIMAALARRTVSLLLWRPQATRWRKWTPYLRRAGRGLRRQQQQYRSTPYPRLASVYVLSAAV